MNVVHRAIEGYITVKYGTQFLNSIFILIHCVVLLYVCTFSLL